MFSLSVIHLRGSLVAAMETGKVTHEVNHNRRLVGNENQ